MPTPDATAARALSSRRPGGCDHCSQALHPPCSPRDPVPPGCAHAQILWTRHCFPDDVFITRDIGAGLMVKTFGGEKVTGHAKTLTNWLENGVFVALAEGYLEKAILVMSGELAPGGSKTTRSRGSARGRARSRALSLPRTTRTATHRCLPRPSPAECPLQPTMRAGCCRRFPSFRRCTG